MAAVTTTIVDIEKIINVFSVFRTQLIRYLSPDYVKLKYSRSRKEQVRLDVEYALSEFDNSVSLLPPDQLMIDEIKLLKRFLQTEIITKNQNRNLDKYTSNAIESGYNYLCLELDIRSASIQDTLFDFSQEKKVKFDDVMIQNIELAIFIKLASRHGLISYNHISDTLRAKCFSLLTNFSENSLRNSMTGKPYKNQNLVEIDKDNIDNLKTILNKILAPLNNWDGNLSSLL